MAMNVGTSWRTRMKHQAMYEMVSEEAWALSSGKFLWVGASIWFDLTAGNGMAVDDQGYPVDRADTESWSRHCSPGILSYLATKSHKPVDITMFELDKATYLVLIEQLDFQLRRLGYKPGNGGLEDFVWVGTSEHGQPIRIRAICGSGHTAMVGHIRRNDAVLVINDPNNPNTWAARDGFAADILKMTKLLRMFHAIGANANGNKRTSLELRRRWFTFIEAETGDLGDNHDLLLCWLTRDSHQWAYMIRTSATWRKKAEGIFSRSFRSWQGGIEFAWYRLDTGRFNAAIKRLVLTSDEYRYEEEEGETLCLF